MNLKLKNVLFFPLHCLLALALAEVFCRIFYPAPPTPKETQKVFVHEKSDNIKLLYKPSPNASNYAYYVQNKINSKGFRDYEYAVEKPADVKRVVFLGDSCVYGYGLELDQTIPKQLEAQFKSKGQKVEVLNLGVSGYESEQEIEFFKEVGLQFKPDLVIVGYTLNDSNYGSWELDLFHSLLNSQVHESGKDPLKLALTFLYAHSRLAAFLDDRLKIQKKVKFLRSYSAPIRRYLEDRNRKNRDPLDSPYRKLEGQIVEDAKRLGTRKVILEFMMGSIGFWAYDLYQSHWYVSKSAFLDLKRLSEERKFKVAVVIFPIMRDMDRYPLESLHAFLRNEFSSIGFQTLDVLELCKKLYTEHGAEKISGDGMHFSPMSARAVAEYIYTRINGTSI